MEVNAFLDKLSEGNPEADYDNLLDILGTVRGYTGEGKEMIREELMQRLE